MCKGEPVKQKPGFARGAKSAKSQEAIAVLEWEGLHGEDDPFFGTNVETIHGMPHSDGSDTVFTSHCTSSDDGKSNGKWFQRQEC